MNFSPMIHRGPGVGFEEYNLRLAKGVGGAKRRSPAQSLPPLDLA